MQTMVFNKPNLKKYRELFTGLLEYHRANGDHVEAMKWHEAIQNCNKIEAEIDAKVEKMQSRRKYRLRQPLPRNRSLVVIGCG